MTQSASLIATRRRELQASLACLPGNTERLAWLVERARQAPGLPEAARTADHEVEGCLAKLWINCRRSEGRCHYACDSNSLVVKAVALVLCDLHSGCTPEEILASDPADLAPLGITQHLTPNRHNALAKVMDRLRQFAQAQSKQLMANDQ